ncbi:efflux RND transporter periplasmic adaptor subunit [Arcobacter defluvii]|uniref:RND family efflux system, membrane fusion protein n=1 Tax=Arcobacter defluvii TaxID=873191 RepID=A0AAE7E5P5_9BACT|nr:efflux RND transporter periplasmic adaptor subunit [Arcobacter defluvii]QKF77030.1 RND family efflux system, membrane fusion protein [Arcobacter defluvii]RXI29797.1 efflux transporter periplasmic adaptor subunit [Arcobacter defluvii]
MIKKSLVAISFLFLGYNGLIAEETKVATEAPALPVQTFKIVKENNTTSKTYPTILKAYEQVDVIARVSGTLKEKYFKEGDLVKKGTLLYKIEPDLYQANFNMKKANFTKAKKDYERAKSLVASKSISPQSFDDYTYQYDSTKAALDEAQINLNYTKVTAPIDGIIGIKNHDIGDLVGTNEDNSLLLTITNTDPIHAEFSLPKDDMNNFLSQIKSKNIKISLIANGTTYENGQIDYIAPTIDTNTDTLLLRAKFDNPNHELIAGNFTKIVISNLSLGDVFIVPENAVLKTAQATIVYVIDENNIAKVRPVTTGDLVKNGMVIKDGLKPNEQIVTSNLAKLRPDTKVQIISEEK